MPLFQISATLFVPNMAFQTAVSIAPVRASGASPVRCALSARGTFGGAALAAAPRAAAPCAPAVASPVPMMAAVNTGFVDATRSRTVIVTGASSSIGLHAARELASRPDVHVVMAVRDIAKGAAAAAAEGLVAGSYTIRELDLSRLKSVREFVASFQQATEHRSLSALVCNAATWHPRDDAARVTEDGFDETVQVNHLGHFLLANLLLPRLKAATGRVVFLATATHNPDTIAGKVPPQANLGDLSGLEKGFRDGYRTIDGEPFEPTKSYKDSKVCNVLTMTEMHRRFAADGVVASAVFPGCIAESGLFREKRGWFRWFFPLFQKFVTRQFVSVEEAGRRVALLAADPRFGDSGKYWQWTGSYLKGTASTTPTPIPPTEREADKAKKLWELSAQLVGLSA